MTFGLLLQTVLMAAHGDMQKLSLRPVFMVRTPTDPAAVEKINTYLEEVRSGANFHQVLVLDYDVQVGVKQGCQHLNPEQSELTIYTGGPGGEGLSVLVRATCGDCGLDHTSDVWLPQVLFD